MKKSFTEFTDLRGLKDFSPVIMVEAVLHMPRHAPYLPGFSELNKQDKPIKTHSYILIT